MKGRIDLYVGTVTFAGFIAVVLGLEVVGAAEL